jgi:hypothetical protein
MSRTLLRFGDGSLFICVIARRTRRDVTVAVPVEPSRAGERGSSSSDTPEMG